MSNKYEHIKLIIKEIQDEILETEERLKVLNNDLNHMNSMALRHASQVSLNLDVDSVAHPRFRFKGVNLRNTILTILKDREGQKVKARQILKIALDGGYETSSNNFESAIYGMIGRLIKDKQIVKTGAGEYMYPKTGAVAPWL